MVDVIKPGRGYVCEVVCTGFGNGGNGCGAVLGCQREDLRYFAGGGYLDREEAVMVKCPECKSVTDIPRPFWPQNREGLRYFTPEWLKDKPEKDST